MRPRSVGLVLVFCWSSLVRLRFVAVSVLFFFIVVVVVVVVLFLDDVSLTLKETMIDL